MQSLYYQQTKNFIYFLIYFPYVERLFESSELAILLRMGAKYWGHGNGEAADRQRDGQQLPGIRAWLLNAAHSYGE